MITSVTYLCHQCFITTFEGLLLKICIIIISECFHSCISPNNQKSCFVCQMVQNLNIVSLQSLNNILHYYSKYDNIQNLLQVMKTAYSVWIFLILNLIFWMWHFPIKTCGICWYYSFFRSFLWTFEGFYGSLWHVA